MGDKKYRFFPMFMRMEGKEILFVGAGKIAERRINVLSDFEGNITVVGNYATNRITELAEAGEIKLHVREFWVSDLDGKDIVICCTNNKELSSEIVSECNKREILVNNASNHDECDFYFPGMVTEGNIVVGVTASGEDHRRAKEIRKKISDILKDESAEKTEEKSEDKI